MAVSLAGTGGKKPIIRVTETESYSNEQFESLADSKTVSNETNEKVLCFLCKQHIPKSQALTHNQTCKKNTGGKKVQKYSSPIREHPEEMQNSSA